MIRTTLALIAVAAMLFGFACSGGTNPTVPSKANQGDIEEFFNSFDLSNPAVAKYTYKDFDGNVLASGTLGRNDDGLYVIESRGAQVDVDLTPFNFLNVWVTYNNPAGTILTGPNAGLPYYYINQTVDYNINILSLLSYQIGAPNPPFGYVGPAEITAEMRYAAFGPNNEIIAGALLPGASTYFVTGIISPGYQFKNDTFLIVPGTIAGLDVTTVRIQAPIFFGFLDLIYFDGVAGVWDPQ